MFFNIIHFNGRSQHDLNKKHHLHASKVRASQSASLVHRKHQEKEDALYVEQRLLMSESAEQALLKHQQSQAVTDSDEFEVTLDNPSKLLHLMHAFRV